MTQSEQVSVQCRLPHVPADVKAGGAHFDFCAFEFPGCDGCPSVTGSGTDFGTIDDPMRSKLLLDWLRGDLHAPI